MVLSHPGEKLAPGRAAERLAGEHEHSIVTRRRHPDQLRLRLRRRTDTDDAVAPLVAIDQFALDRTQRILIVIDRE